MKRYRLDLQLGKNKFYDPSILIYHGNDLNYEKPLEHNSYDTVFSFYVVAKGFTVVIA